MALSVTARTRTVTRREWAVDAPFGSHAAIGDIEKAIDMARTQYHRDKDRLADSDDWLRAEARDDEIVFYYTFEEK